MEAASWFVKGLNSHLADFATATLSVHDVLFGVGAIGLERP